MAETIVGISTPGVTFDWTFDGRALDTVKLLCTGLGAAETVTISFNVAGTWETLRSFDANGATNVAVLFTGSGGAPANVAAFTGEGLMYRFQSTTPAGTVKIVATHGFRTNG